MTSRREVLFCGVVVLLALIACKQLKSPGSGGCCRSLTGKNADIEQVMFATWHFRDLAKRNYALGLTQYADPPVRAKLVSFEDDLWPTADPKVGWAYLVDASVLCAGAMRGGQIPVAFYHPWSDVFLVLLWKLEKSGPRIHDVEVLTGEFVRRGHTKALRTARGWTEQKSYGPYAVGFAVADSVRAFEQMFSEDKLEAGGFRAAHEGMKNETALEVNHLAAGKQLMENMAEMAPLFDSSVRGTAGAKIRGRLADITDQFVRRRAADVAREADGTPGAAGKALKEMTIEDWRRFKLTGYVPGNDRHLVLLSHGDNPDTFMGLLFVSEGPGLRLKRADILSFKAFVENDDTLKREVAK